MTVPAPVSEGTGNLGVLHLFKNPSTRGVFSSDFALCTSDDDDLKMTDYVSRRSSFSPGSRKRTFETKTRFGWIRHDKNKLAT